MKLLILTCLVALAIARPMVEKISESEEEVIEVPEKHLHRRYSIPVKNEHQVEDRYVLPETNTMNLYYQHLNWPEEMRKIKMPSLPTDKKMVVLKSITQNEMLSPVQHRSLPLPKAKVLARAHSQMLPILPLRMVPLLHRQLAIPKQEILPISEREREILSAHERENLSAHKREIPLVLEREMPLVAEREILVAPERIVLPENNILPVNEREVQYVPKREVLSVLEKEKFLPLFQHVVLRIPQREMEPIHHRDTNTPREILPIVQQEVMPELVPSEFYPFSQPVTNFYYPTELNEKN
ncbi:beta-casein [Macrotis lagotis]|uniref:beta-casein n=1 Tax=Macrotis lagotis TaxID=92651 RepID=UPI003D693FA0